MYVTAPLHSVHCMVRFAHRSLSARARADGWLGAITFGGFGLGWLRDAYRIPEYVAAANNEQRWSERLAVRMKRDTAPKAYFAIGVAQYAVGAYLSYCVAASVFFVEWALYAIG